LGREVNFNSWK